MDDQQPFSGGAFLWRFAGMSTGGLKGKPLPARYRRPVVDEWATVRFRSVGRLLAVLVVAFPPDNSHRLYRTLPAIPAERSPIAA
jgi:hypothetical protein